MANVLGTTDASPNMLRKRATSMPSSTGTGMLPTMGGVVNTNPRATVGSHYTTPVGNRMASENQPESMDLSPNDMQVDGSAVQAARTKKLQFVAAELKRMRYF